MRSCIFRILFRMHEINCMNIRRILHSPAEVWQKPRNRRNSRKFRGCLEIANLWKSLWTV